jgi:ketosteroid isomerase-like protein
VNFCKLRGAREIELWELRDGSNAARSKRIMTQAMNTRFTVLIFAIVSISAEAQPNPAEAEIRATRQASNEAIRRHDIKSFATSLDTDFSMIRGNGVLAATRQAYIDLFVHDFADPQAIRYERVPDQVEISSAAPLAAEHGHWIGTHADGSRAYGGTYLAMWRKTEAGWKIRSELFVVLVCHDGPACAGYRKP